MIRLERASLPPVLSSPRADTARERAREFFSRAPKARAQDRFRLDARLLDSVEIKEALWTLTSGKCAYCESPLGPALPLEANHFRPAMAAMNLDGELSQDHYWWLAYEWDNLLPSCAECARMKGSRFPVAEKRAAAPTRGQALEEEKPYLLDPGADDAQLHLVFTDDGEVVSKDERGRVTIEVLGLNRRRLLLARAEELTRLHASWRSATKGRAPAATVLQEMTASSQPFAALRRQFVATWTDEQAYDRPAGARVASAKVSAREQAALKSRFHDRKRVQERYSLARAGRDADYFITTRLIERVVIENVRVVKSLELEVSERSTKRAPWLMLLGENGTGKSSVLEAVTLVLVGDRYRRRLGIRPADYVRRGERKGFVEVHLTGSDEPLRLEITKSDFRANVADPKVLLLGYGATRLLPRPRMRPKRLRSDAARVENLFDPFSPLGDAADWLLELPAPAFAMAARALKGILALEDDAELRRSRRGRRIEVDMLGERVPLEHLSDGYQSVLGLAVDVMSVMFRRWPSMDVAEGIVVIDELGAHLHPRWRMRIVTSLRDVFPRIQFVASTHDPLCLRGLVDGEVAVLRRDEEQGVVAITDLPPIEGLRIDQLLTSEVFGLSSTIDPELDALFARYYQLKGKWKLSAAEEEELDRLRSDLDGYQILGQTARERLMLEAADMFLAQERRLGDGRARRELRQATKRRMAELWAETEPLEPPLR